MRNCTGEPRRTKYSVLKESPKNHIITIFALKIGVGLPRTRYNGKLDKVAYLCNRPAAPIMRGSAILERRRLGENLCFSGGFRSIVVRGRLLRTSGI